MRVPNISLYTVSAARLNTLTNDLKNANEVVSTQKQLNAISDDPIRLSQTLNLKAAIENLEQLDTNVEMGLTWVTNIESALDSVSDQLEEAKLLCLQLVNASANTSDRADAVDTVSGIIDQVMALGNTRISNRYLFSGTATDQAAFVYDNDENPTAVIYQGNESAFCISTGQSAVIAVGAVGSEIFSSETDSSGIFETLFSLKQYLANDDVDGISQCMTQLDIHYNSITSHISSAGVTYNRLETTRSISSATQLSLAEQKSQIEDADIVESVMNLTAAQTAYEAALNATAKIIDISLADYI